MLKSVNSIVYQYKLNDGGYSMPNKIKICFITLIALISFPLISLNTISLNTANTQVDEKAAESANVLYASMKFSASNKIPSSLLKITRCIIVIPSLVKAGILVTVERGKGLASCRHPETGKWGALAFYNATGWGIGLSIGGGSFDIITLVTSNLGAGELVSGKVILGSSKATAVA